MANLVIKKGYDLKLAGKPAPEIADAAVPAVVGLRPDEFRGVKPSVLVEDGQPVEIGTPLFCNKAIPEIVFVSPAAGTVRAVERGERRKLLGISVNVAQGNESRVQHPPLDPRSASPEQIRGLILATGCWPFIQQHPFNHMAHPQDRPKAVFVTAAPSDPFAPDPNLLLADKAIEFQAGIDALARMTGVTVHLVTRAQASVGQALQSVANVTRHTVSGPHPSGDPAVHAFYIDPPKTGEVVWTLRADQVALVGQACLTGSFPTDRLITLAGNGVQPDQRRYYRTRAGAMLESLAGGRIVGGPDENRFISGSVLTGTSVGPFGYLGLLDNMVTILPEGSQRRELLGWLWPGLTKYSWSRAFLSAINSSNSVYALDTNLNGGIRACFQSGHCLEVCPTDTLPLHVWKAVSYGDLEEAEKLGITECVNCGLCSYVCPAKIEIDTIIQQGLQLVEKGD